MIPPRHKHLKAVLVGQTWQIESEPASPVKSLPRRRRHRRPWVMCTVIAVLCTTFTAIALPGEEPFRPTGWIRYVPGKDALTDAVPVGAEAGMTLYSCRTKIQDGIEIGRFRADFKGCHVGYGGKEVETASFDLLGSQWRAPTPVDAGMDAGKISLGDGEQYTLDSVAPCRVEHGDGVQIGGTAGQTCKFGFGGAAMSSKDFLVLLPQAWLTWTAAVAHNLPDSAVRGGEESGETQYVCRASTDEGLLVGKIKRSSTGCSVASDGREVIAPRFEVLAPRWMVSAGGGVPVGATPVGRDSSGLLYLCRGRTHSMMQPGKLNERLDGCHVGMQGGESILQDYEVMSQ